MSRELWIYFRLFADDAHILIFEKTTQFFSSESFFALEVDPKLKTNVWRA
jgi:hypothetical protein